MAPATRRAHARLQRGGHGRAPGMDCDTAQQHHTVVMADKVSTRELGLILGVRLMKTDDLHYGYWTDGLDVNLGNLAQAQRQYCDVLMDRIPSGVRTILDVGCGTGHLAQLLTERGYQVDCISPSPVLTRLARERLGEEYPIHRTTYEAFASDRRFDLILFSESFQYIKTSHSLPKSVALLEDPGYVLISDFFLTNAPGVSALRGGHDLDGFYAYLQTLPLRILSDEDITRQTAPNLQLVDELLTDYALPIWESVGYFLRQNHPWLAKLGWLLYRKKLEKIEFKYLSRQRTAGSFAIHKSYRTILLQKLPPTAAGDGVT